MISIDLTFRHALRLLLLGGAGLVEQGLHGGVLAGKFLYGEILGLVVSQTQVTFASQQVLLDLLQMVDGLVYLVDGLREALAGEPVVAAELVLEVGQLVLEVRHVDVLLAHEGQFAAGIHG